MNSLECSAQLCESTERKNILDSISEMENQSCYLLFPPSIFTVFLLLFVSCVQIYELSKTSSNFKFFHSYMVGIIATNSNIFYIV